MHPEYLRIEEILREMRGRRVLVIGDVMLDRYESGEVARLSPEAPVPVLKKVEHHDVPGGAANVAMNISALGGSVNLVGVTGSDEEARALRRLLDESGVEYELFEEERPTTLKTRFMHKSQQFLRLDREVTDPISAEVMDSVLAAVEGLLSGSDCAVFADYAKGFFSPAFAGRLTERIDGARVPLVVDPKPANSYLCERCHLFMPNRDEGALIAGIADAGELDGGLIAERLREKYCNNVILTDGKNGMFVAPIGGEITHIESRASEVFDVSGAGDTASAAVALAVGAGSGLVEAAALSNEAAGIAVSKLGTAVVTPEEIVKASSGGERILSWDELEEAVGDLRKVGKKVVFTNGCFDLLHVGHIKYLKAARELGDALVVALNSDESVRRLKGPDRPLISERQRAELIVALESVDYVTVFGQDTPEELIDVLRPDVFVKGGDYTEERLPEAPLVRSYGGSVEIVPIFGDGISTTSLIERISGSGDTDE